MVLHRLFIICEFLVVLVFLYSSLIILTSFSPRLPLVFFSGIQVSIRGIFVFLFAQIVSVTRHVLFDESMFPYSYVLPVSPSTSSSPYLHPIVFPLISPPTPAAASQPLLYSNSSSQSALSPHSLHCLRLCLFCHLHSPLSLLILTSSLRIYVWSYLFHH
jgi:hypothetical protein